MKPETFGEKVARLRKEKQMTQANLAQIMHVTDKAVSKWECDVAYPEITTLPLLAESLGTSVDALLAKTESKSGTVQPRKVLGIVLSSLIILLSIFQLVTTRLNHESWMFDCIQLLVLGGVFWSFQKREWTENGTDSAFQIFIILIGVSVFIWMFLEDVQDTFNAIAGCSIALLGARLMCLPVGRKSRDKPENQSK